MERTVEAGASMVPVVGGPVAVAFNTALGWSFTRRMDQWLDDLAEAVSELQQRTEGLSFDDLARNDDFVDAVVSATRAAQATHAEEKLAALRNGVLSTLGPNAPTADEQARFFRLVEQFTPAHLRLLAFLDDPGAAFDAAGKPRPSLGVGGKWQLVEQGMPEFKDKREWYDLLDRDIAAAGLTKGNGQSILHTNLSSDGLWNPGTNSLGRRFLAFISEPSH